MAALVERGYDLIGGKTTTLCSRPVEQGRHRQTRRASPRTCAITVNKNMVPFDTRSPFVTSGMRVGTPAVTTRGLVESDMVQLVEWMDAVIQAPEDEAVIQRVGDAVRAKMGLLPLVQE